MGALMSGITAVAEDVGLPVPMPPSSLIGVQALFEPDVLVEVGGHRVCSPECPSIGRGPQERVEAVRTTVVARGVARSRQAAAPGS